MCLRPQYFFFAARAISLVSCHRDYLLFAKFLRVHCGSETEHRVRGWLGRNFNRPPTRALSEQVAAPLTRLTSPRHVLFSRRIGFSFAATRSLRYEFVSVFVDGRRCNESSNRSLRASKRERGCAAGGRTRAREADRSWMESGGTKKLMPNEKQFIIRRS